MIFKNQSEKRCVIDLECIDLFSRIGWQEEHLKIRLNNSKTMIHNYDVINFDFN